MFWSCATATSDAARGFAGPNLLVLLVVGSTSKDLIARHKRFGAFGEDDYDLLAQVTASAAQIMVTPNTLTEASILFRHLGEPARTAVMLALKRLIGVFSERHTASRHATEHESFVRLGLADAAQLTVLANGEVLLTCDLALYLAALRGWRDAINFNHLRDAALFR